MANELTGDFDVVAEFAIPAVNRILAAMHRIERFPHSIAARVDDTPSGVHGELPTLVSVLDGYGDSLANHDRIGFPHPLGFEGGLNGGFVSSFDPVVNFDNLGILDEPIVPSHLKGRVQLQLFPPTIEVAGTTGSRLTVRIELLARYFPDAGTSPVAEFVRGDLKITAPLNQVASQRLNANIIDIDIKAISAVINFTPHWSSRPISGQDLAAINRFIRNSLKTSFLPSNAQLPSKIKHMQFRALSGPRSAVAVMLDMDGSAGNPATAANVFLNDADGFAFAINGEYLKAALRPALDNLLAQPVDPVKFKVESFIHTWHITYTITLSTADVRLENGRIVLEIRGHAHTGTSWLPDFDFTVRQLITISVSGSSAYLALGAMTLDTSSTAVNLFKAPAVEAMKGVRDRSFLESDVQGTAQRMLSAEENLGGFLRSLLSPARGQAPSTPLQFTLGYTSADIKPAGIVLHGVVAITAWPLPRVEFEKIPVNASDPILAAVPSGPDYSALKTWIPGGTIDRFEWHSQGTTQGYIDQNRFVFISQPPTSVADSGPSPSGGSNPALDLLTHLPASLHIPSYAPLCLTVHGTRLTSSGNVASQAVTATACGLGGFNVAGTFEVADGGLAPMIALVRSGPNGKVEIIGHAEASAQRSRASTPNLIVHFADRSTAANLDKLAHSYRNSRRANASTGILVVGNRSLISSARFASELTYAEDDDGRWARHFGVMSKEGAVTLVINPQGHEVYRFEGDIDAEKFASALNKVLIDRAHGGPDPIVSNVRLDQRPPNFVFEYAPGQQMTLRKTRGSPQTLIFWRSASAASIDAVKDAEASHSRAGSGGVFAINDGDSEGLAMRTAKEAGIKSTVVADPKRKISTAYGIAVWPTVISLDSDGIVRSVRQGRASRGKNND